jgi:CRISPR-associated protein Cmr6
LLWKKHDLAYKVSGQQHQEREYEEKNIVPALKEATSLSKCDRDAMSALAHRQSAQAVTFAPDNLLSLAALATAPFTTGLGNEHPLENGFAFLNPYGLPYLPGSGVKGVLRQAARELAGGDWGDAKGWSESPIYTLMQGEGTARKAVLDERTKSPVKLSMLDALFGLESDDGGKVHVRGALAFWDVVPQIKGDSLAVEIMTPHQGHYYQHNPAAGSTNPHDSGQPIPISYLTVPPGSGFTFYVVCDLPFLRRIAPSLAEDGHWKALLTAAFEHAFQWLGFGAKTAVGYGAMRENPAARDKRERQRDEDQAKARRANLSPEDLAWEDHQQVVETFRQQFETAKKSRYNPGTFNQPRYDFMNTALTWKDTRSRQAAGELLKATMTKAWGTPGNTDSKRRIVEAVDKLCSKCP